MQRTRWGIVAVAVVVAAGLGLLAPASWPEHQGVIEATYRGRPVDPGGITLERGNPLFVHVQILEQGQPIHPELDGVRVTLVLPDGRRELVPVVGWDRQAQALEAERRPPAQTRLALALLGLVVVLWVTEAVPLHVTSLLIPIILVSTGAMGAKPALAPFFHPIIALFFGGFLMAESMRRVGLERYAALAIVARAGRSPTTLFAALVGGSAFLSMWMSNTASTAMLVPIALAVTEPLAHAGFRKAVVLGIAYAATIGGVGSAIGTPANPIAIEFLGTFAGREISFLGWFGFGLPMVFLFLPLMGFYLWRRSKVNVDPERFAEARRIARAELERIGRTNRDQRVVLAVFAGVMLLWLTQTWHHIHPGIVALAGAVALMLLGKLRTKDLGRISWSALLTFGGGLCLGIFLLESGTSDWVATRMTGLADLPPLIGIAAVALVALGLTTIASNTATAAMLVPLALPLAGVLGVDPALLVIVVAIASSVDFALVIGTPPTMIAYSTRLYKAREIFRAGIVLDLAGLVLLITVVVGFWRLVGLV